jgi:hypothetical protein
MVAEEDLSRNDTEPDLSMSGAAPSEVNEGSVKAACVALVPLGAMPVRPARTDYSLTRPDPRFVTHLIAMAGSSPQTRLLRRATPEVAQAAYRSVADRNWMPAMPGIRTRQVA